LLNFSTFNKTNFIRQEIGSSNNFA